MTFAEAKEIIRRRNALIASGEMEAPAYVDPFEAAEAEMLREQEESVLAAFGGVAGLRSHLEQVIAEGVTRYASAKEFIADIEQMIAEDQAD